MKKLTKILISVLAIAGTFVIIGAVLANNKEKNESKRGYAATVCPLSNY